MLQHLLELLASGGVHTPAQLADELGVSRALMDQMLADLTRLGYLKPVAKADCRTAASADTTGCPHCPIAETCTLAGPGGRTWALTPKGSSQLKA